MALNENVGHDCLARELGVTAPMSRIGPTAQIKPGPAVESARLHVADIIGHKIFTQIIAFVRAHPELTGPWIKCYTNRVANAPRINLLSGAVGIKFENASAIRFPE